MFIRRLDRYELKQNEGTRKKYQAYVTVRT